MVKQLPKAVISGTLEEAIAQIRKLSGAQIVVSWRSLTTTGARRSTKVSMKAQNVSIGQVLDEIPKTASEKPQERFLLEAFSPDAEGVFTEPRS